MDTGAVIRVLCDDGPCKGPQFMDADTGHILFNDSPGAAASVYRIENQPSYTHESTPHARLDHLVEPGE